LVLWIAGRYTLESRGSVRIDGQVVKPGESVELSRGPHRFAAVDSTERIKLRWGDKLYRPADPPPAPSPFLGF
jgi:hypothetical protein